MTEHWSIVAVKGQDRWGVADHMGSRQEALDLIAWFNQSKPETLVGVHFETVDMTIRQEVK